VAIRWFITVFRSHGAHLLRDPTEPFRLRCCPAEWRLLAVVGTANNSSVFSETVDDDPEVVNFVGLLIVEDIINNDDDKIVEMVADDDRSLTDLPINNDCFFSTSAFRSAFKMPMSWSEVSRSQ